MSLKIEKHKIKSEDGKVRYVSEIGDEADFFEARDRIRDSFEDSDLKDIINKTDSPDELMIAQKMAQKFVKERSERSIPSTPANPPQGSVVSLEGNRGTSKKWVYDSPLEAIEDLRKKSEQARLKRDRASPDEKQAKELYDRLWAMAMRQVHDQLEAGGRFTAFEMRGCVVCGRGYDVRKYENTCPHCSADQLEVQIAGLW